jgi:hypothetical protein
MAMVPFVCHEAIPPGTATSQGKKSGPLAVLRSQPFSSPLAFSSTIEGVCSAQVQAQNKHSRRLKAVDEGLPEGVTENNVGVFLSA